MRGITKKLVVLLFVLSLVFTCASAQDKPTRGIWISTVFNLDYPSSQSLSADNLRKEIDDIITNMVRADLNAAYFQVRPCADSFYPSKIFPYSVYFTGNQNKSPPEKFDSLAYFIEKAHAKNIEVHAWLNPYRVTKNSPGTMEAALSQLAEWHPARQTPELVRLFSDGNIYFDPALPEVQKLVVAGACEISQNYDVDGIHLDDYFYPGQNFDDNTSFAQYGAGRTLGDFRRDNVTNLITSLSQSLDKINPALKFGVSPFGIWANRADGIEGSETSGSQSYFDHYADTRAWVKNGLLDYISPQLYWNAGHANADFDALLSWWIDATQSTKCELIPGLAAYRAMDSNSTSPWFGTREIASQLQKLSAQGRGCILFRYGSIVQNPALYQAVSAPKPISKSKLSVARPSANISTELAEFYFCGTASSDAPVTINGQNVSARGVDGSWGVLLSLELGKNNFEISCGESKIMREVLRTPSLPQPLPCLPLGDTILEHGRSADLSVGVGGNSATALLFGKSHNLQKSDGGFSASITLPAPKNREITSFGTPIYYIKRGNLITPKIGGGEICAIGRNAQISFETKTDLCDIYYKPDSTQGSSDYILGGTRGRASKVENGYVYADGLGYISAQNVELTREFAAQVVTPSGAQLVGRDIEINFAAKSIPAAICKFEDGKFEITMSGAVSHFPLAADILQNCETTIDGSNLKFVFSINDFVPQGWYFKHSKNMLTLVIRQKVIPDSELKNVKILLDAGHGGKATGAIGCNGEIAEKDINLSLAKELGSMLEAHGAIVTFTRKNDVDVSLKSRFEQSYLQMPDLYLSLHSNISADNVDISTAFGVSTFCQSAHSKPLAQAMADAVQNMGRAANPAQSGSKLYVCRQNFTTAILFENGFLPNPNEFYDITSQDGIKNVARAISDCILNYYIVQ